MQIAIQIVKAALEALAAVAPSVAKAITGGQSVEEAIEAAEEEARGIGTLDEWDDDLADRLARG